MKYLYDRAQELAEKQIKENVSKLEDPQLKVIASAIITTNALITAQLIEEYEKTKRKA